MRKISITVSFATAVLTVGSVLSAVAVLVFSSEVRFGVGKGIMLCTNNVIPSLFLFTAVGLFVSYSGVSGVLGQIISPVTRLVFGLEGDTATVFLLSTVSGYPVGARLVDTLYQNGKITRAKALKMLTFSVNAGPSFVVTAVGLCMLKSTEIGVRLLVAHLTSTVIIAVAVRFLPERIFKSQTQNVIAPRVQRFTVAEAFVTSVAEAGKTVLNICAFVVFFSGVGEVLTKLLPENSPEVIGFLEITVGLANCTSKQMPLVAFLLGFGGLSVIFQVMLSAKAVAPKFLFVAVTRTVHGMLSVAVIKVLNYLFPLAIETGSFTTASAKLSNNSLPAAIAMLILCATLLCFWERTRKAPSR